MKKANNFQIAKVQPQGVVWLLLDFYLFQPGVIYKSVSYKKACKHLTIKSQHLLVQSQQLKH